MIDYTAIRRAVEMALEQNYTMTPIQFENVPIDDQDAEEFIAVFDTIDDITEVDLNTNVVSGTLSIRIYTPLWSGTERSREIADELNRLFRGTWIEGLVFKEGELHGFPIDTADTHFIQNLMFPYIADASIITC